MRVPRHVQKKLLTAQNERVEYIFRRHWLWVFKRVFWTALISGFIFLVTVRTYPGVAALALIIGVLICYGQYSRWRRRLLVLTNLRLLGMQGLVKHPFQFQSALWSEIKETKSNGHGFIGGAMGSRRIDVQASGDKAFFFKGYPVEAHTAIDSMKAKYKRH